MDPAKRHEPDLCQEAIAFVNGKPFVNSTLISATKMAQLKANIESVSLKLSNEVKSEKETIRHQHPMPF